MQPALQDEARRSRGVWGPTLAEHRSKTDPTISGQAASSTQKMKVREARLKNTWGPNKHVTRPNQILTRSSEILLGPSKTLLWPSAIARFCQDLVAIL